VILVVVAGACCGCTSRPATALRTCAPSTVRADRPHAPGPWHCVFDDEFTGRTLDPANWVTCYDWSPGGCTSAGNNELEWYQPGQVSVGPDGLTLLAQRRTVTAGTGVRYPWVSGMISTGRDGPGGSPHFSFAYGYATADVQLSRAPGMLPAFWLLPADESWPPEIDIMEGVENTVALNVHFVGADGNGNAQARHVYGRGDFTSRYHNFAVDWEPHRLTWYIDGVQRYTVTDPAAIPHVAMDILFTLAVGYPRAPSPDTQSSTLHVKDVQVWQR